MLFVHYECYVVHYDILQILCRTQRYNAYLRTKYIDELQMSEITNVFCEFPKGMNCLKLNPFRVSRKQTDGKCR